MGSVGMECGRVTLWQHKGRVPGCCCVTASLRHVRLSGPRAAARQAPLSMGFPRQEYWRGLVISFSRVSSWPRDQTPVSCLAGRFFTTEPPGKPCLPSTYSLVDFLSILSSLSLSLVFFWFDHVGKVLLAVVHLMNGTIVESPSALCFLAGRFAHCELLVGI